MCSSVVERVLGKDLTQVRFLPNPPIFMMTKEQRREYNRTYVARRRAEWFAGKTCIKCGSEENLEIHHVDPSTKEAHQVWTWTKERRDLELAKCDVLCKNCHKIETLLQLVKFEHGTRTMYTRHGCRCEPCIKAAADYREKQRLLSGRKHQLSYKP
jgi:5-methylcytosine-specific restriction endonuclease McrA